MHNTGAARSTSPAAHGRPRSANTTPRDGRHLPRRACLLAIILGEGAHKRRLRLLPLRFSRTLTPTQGSSPLMKQDGNSTSRALRSTGSSNHEASLLAKSNDHSPPWLCLSALGSQRAFRFDSDSGFTPDLARSKFVKGDFLEMRKFSRPFESNYNQITNSIETLPERRSTTKKNIFFNGISL